MKYFSIIMLLSFYYMSSQEANKAADSLFALGRYSEAIKEYSSFGLDSSNFVQQRIAKAYEKLGSFDKALNLYEEMITLKSDNILIKYELGKLYLKVLDYENAKIVFSQLVDRKSDNPNFHFYLGKAKQKMNDSTFIDHYMDSYKVDNEYSGAIENLARYHLGKNNTDSTLFYCSKGLRKYSNNVTLIGYKAQAYFNGGLDSLAIPQFEKLISMGFEKEHIIEKLANSYYNIKNLDSALKYGNRMLEIEDKDSKNHYFVGLIHQEKGNLENAIFHFKKSLELKKVTNANEYLRLIEIYKDQKNLKKTIDYYVLLVGERPNYTMGYYQIAFLADNYYQDPELRIYHYKRFLDRVKDNSMESHVEYATKRIQELKAEIHFNSN